MQMDSIDYRWIYRQIDRQIRQTERQIDKYNGRQIYRWMVQTIKYRQIDTYKRDRQLPLDQYSVVLVGIWEPGSKSVSRKPISAFPLQYPSIVIK